jgi:hypothetical protein
MRGHDRVFNSLKQCVARVGAVFAGLGLVLVLGCGDDSGLATRYKVSGTVTYKGQPVEKGLINFVPTSGDGRAASGNIKNGSYYLTTATDGDGALPGSYKVTVSSQEIDSTELKAVAKGGQFHHDKAFANANKTAKNLVPSRYQLAETSDLTATVEAKSNNLPFDLKD